MSGCPFLQGALNNKASNHPDQESETTQQEEVTYANYIRTRELLTLPDKYIDTFVKTNKHHHDEHLFIIVHQSFELWFKQILFELSSVRDLLLNDMNTHGKVLYGTADLCVQRVNRADKILRYTLGTFDILETMHPSDFLEFRDYIGPASGFQSVQMREMELLMGLEDSHRFLLNDEFYLYPLSNDEFAMSRINLRRSERSILAVLNEFLHKLPVPEDFIPNFIEAKRRNLVQQKKSWHVTNELIDQVVAQEMAAVTPFLEGDEYKEGDSDHRAWVDGHDAFIHTKTTLKAHENAQKAKEAAANGETAESSAISEEEALEKKKRARLALLFLSSYRHDVRVAAYANLLDSLVAFEEGFVLWRSHHARMVERMIGRRAGTGGSSGVEYLDKTCRYRVFIDLWRVRSLFVKPSVFPNLKDDYSY